MSVPSSSFTIDDIQNTDATQYDQNKNTVCERSGFKLKVKDGIAIEYNGIKVRHDSYDPKHFQLDVRLQAELLTGPIQPEGADTFLAVNEVKATDL